MKILLAVDGSAYTKRMLAYLAEHQQWFGADHEYTVFHGVLALPPRAAAFATAEQIREYYAADAEAVFKPIRQFLERRGIKAEYVSKAGRPGDNIAKLAEKGKFELLVMGSRGYGSLGSLILGSVASRVLAQCATPVLLIR